MRPLKPYTVALGGLIAAVFGALFFGVHGGNAPTTLTTGVRPDVQSKSVATAPSSVVSRDTTLEYKAPLPPLLPFLQFSASDDARRSNAPRCLVLRGATKRLSDQRRLLLVGVVELRI
jgi:hypothetical protein